MKIKWCECVHETTSRLKFFNDLFKLTTRKKESCHDNFYTQPNKLYNLMNKVTKCALHHANVNESNFGREFPGIFCLKRITHIVLLFDSMELY